MILFEIFNDIFEIGKSGKAPALLLRTFQQYFMSSEAQRYFQMPTKVNSNRVQKQQLKIIHKESGIECFLLFDNDISVTTASQIINDFIALKPICMYCLKFNLTFLLLR